MPRRSYSSPTLLHAPAQLFYNNGHGNGVTVHGETVRNNWIVCVVVVVALILAPKLCSISIQYSVMILLRCDDDGGGGSEVEQQEQRGSGGL